MGVMLEATLALLEGLVGGLVRLPPRGMEATAELGLGMVEATEAATACGMGEGAAILSSLWGWVLAATLAVAAMGG